MSSAQPLESFHVGNAQVQIYASREELGKAAALRAVEIISAALERHGKARVIAATGNSQIPLIDELVRHSVNWSSVELFHMDEYIGLGSNHPSSFRYWTRTRLVERVRPGKVFYMDGDAADLETEMKRYSQLLLAEPIDVAFVGFGENGHIAFNDPSTADFDDLATVKKVALDEACRKQQVGEKHFKDIDSVPAQAVTITCTGLLRANHWVCCVPEARKAEAVRNALTGPISETCPASLVRRHPNANVYLDRDSASLLSEIPGAVAGNTP
jgi:glucosamine-6-phosphate deaminase